MGKNKVSKDLQLKCIFTLIEGLGIFHEGLKRRVAKLEKQVNTKSKSSKNKKHSFRK